MGLLMPKPKPTILLTRPEAQSKEFAEALRAGGFDGEIVISPLIDVRSTGVEVALSRDAQVAFTSRNALDFVTPQPRIAWCVGDKTAEKANGLGWRACSADGDVDQLFQLIADAAPKTEIVHLRGEHSRGALVDRLIEQGIPARDVVVYKQVALELTEEAKGVLSGNSPLLVPLFSPRSAALMALQGPFTPPLCVVAMSEAVAAELESIELGEIHVAKAPTAEAMCKSVLSLVSSA